MADDIQILTFEQSVRKRPSPKITSFANDARTICGGSLVDGILEGLLIACKAYVKKNNLATFKINRKKCLNGLIIVCAVRGEDYKYGGSFKETLEEKIVKKQAREVVATLAMHFFNTQKEKASKFIARFDTTVLANKMYLK